MSTEILISTILLVISIIFFLFQPQKINKLYGYRTRKSMSSIENWKLSNKYSAKGMLIISILNLTVFYIISLFVSEINKYIYLIVLLIEFILLFYLTEKKITQNENK